MRICQIIASQGEGGLEKHARELAQQLNALGHEVVVFGAPALLATLHEGIHRQPIHAGLGRRNPLLLLELLFRLRRCRCDLVHAQANKAAALVSALRGWLDSPTVGTLHNIKRAVRPFQHLDHVIAVSRALVGPFDPAHVSVVYNGISPPTFAHLDLRTALQLPMNQPLLCAVGRLVEAKGFDVLLEAIDGLPLSLIIVGEGPERTRLEGRIAKLSHMTHVRLLGQRTDVASLMASADAVVISSRREGFSYVCNEALLVGARILSTDVPVANEVLPADLIVPVDNPQALRARLLALLSDLDGWSALMASARNFACERMTLKAMVANTLAVYEKVLRHE